MCGKQSKKYSGGLKTIVVLLLLLSVALSPLAAWPTWLGGSGNQAEQISHLEEQLQEKQERIQSAEKLISQLEKQLDALMENSNGSTSTIEDQESLIASLKEQLTSLKADRENLQIAKEKAESELKMLKELYGISEESYQAMKTDYDDLADKYAEKADESDEYYQELVQMKAKVQEQNEQKFHGSIGSAMLFTPDGARLGAELEAGIGFKDVTFSVGAQYMIPDTGFSVESLAPDKLTYKAGLRMRF